MSKRYAWVPAVAAAAASLGAAQWVTPRVDVVLPDRTVVHAELADNEAVRERGLMFRTDLPAGQGMLFVFDEPGRYPFWMQNCLIPIDIVWLDVEGKVVTVAASVPPCRLPACNPPCASDACPTYGGEALAKYVLEVPSGFAKQHDVKVGEGIGLPKGIR
jgi:uncharacterized membrane protein (UPF0127 family)